MAEGTPEQKWPQTLWVVRHGQSAGNVARDLAEAGNLPVIAIADRQPGRPLLAPRRGPGVGLAASGWGDVLAGVVAGLAARGGDLAQAAVWGVWLHARAGRALRRRHGALGFLPREPADEVPRLLARPRKRPPSR